jgi:hypothetical protein
VAETVRFSRSLYSSEGVAAAAEAYAPLAKITVTEEPNDLLVQLEPIDAGVPDLVDAFLNHALHATISLSRGGAL